MAADESDRTLSTVAAGSSHTAVPAITPGPHGQA
jgi:hypothetical protein